MQKREVRSPQDVKPIDSGPYYADPDRPGKSRHALCFLEGTKPHSSGYERTAGPCWVCQLGIHDRTMYLASFRVFEDLETVAATLGRLCKIGFKLTTRISVGTGGLCAVEREKLEHGDPELLSAFRNAWVEARAVADFSSLRPLGMASLYGHEAYCRCEIPPLSELDPRVHLRGEDPSTATVVEVVRLIGVLGRLGYIAQMIETAVKNLRAMVQANRGPDCDEPLHRLVETYGASPQRLAETALAFLDPKPAPSETDPESQRVKRNSLKERVRSLAGKLRQRASRKNKDLNTEPIRRKKTQCDKRTNRSRRCHTT